MDRIPPPDDGDELTTLSAFLEYLRGCIIAKLEGCDDAQSKQSQLPSGTSIYWLGTHMARDPGRNTSKITPPTQWWTPTYLTTPRDVP